MRRALAAVLVLAAGCGEEMPFGPWPSAYTNTPYFLVPQQTFSVHSEGRISGVAWDGAAYWIATWNHVLPPLTGADRFELHHVDPAGTPLGPPWVFDQAAEDVYGLAWLDGELWLAYRFGATHFQAFDPSTGAALRSFTSPDSVGDLEAIDSHLAVASYFNEVAELSLTDGWTVAATPVPCFPGSTLYGVATVTPPGRPPELWVSGTLANQMAVLVDGEVAAFVPYYQSTPARTHLQFADQRLTTAYDNQIHVYDIDRDPR
jgi:hypothetical protein